jgi:hypothetical protein
MIWQHIRVAMLAGGILAVVGSTRAEDASTPAPGAAAPAACSTPCYKTVCSYEWVPEKYTTTRTVYERVSHEEKYEAHRCEWVTQTQTYNVTVCQQVWEEKEIIKHVCVSVPVVEERTVMQTHVSYKPESHVVRKCVDKGHYECKEVPCGPSFSDRVRKLCSRHKDCCDDCCEPCCPPKTKTVKCWVPCPVWEEHVVCSMKKVCESVPVKIHVTCYKTQINEVKEKIKVCKSVPTVVTKTCEVKVMKMVPYKATRTVWTCVPRQETVVCTRMVCHKVEKQVPVECCAETCCTSKHHRSCGHSFRHHSCGCD